VMNFKMRPVGMDASMLTITSRLKFRQDSLLHYLRLMFDRSEELNLIDYLENIDEVAIGTTGGIEVYLQRIEPFHYLSVTDSCKLEEVSNKMESMYNELLVFGARARIDMTARPVVIYHLLSEKKVIFEMGIPVFENVTVSGRIRYTTMQGGDHVVANYFGSYDTLEDGHNAVQQWMIRYRRKLAGYPWELYVTDPTTEPDPNNWLTRIYYPVN